jgi:hypothetical protein
MDVTESRSLAKRGERKRGAKITPLDVARIVDEVNDIRAERDIHLETWRQAVDYTQPDRNIFDGQQAGQERTPDKTFDSYPLDATQRGIGNVLSSLIPVGGDWAEAVAGHMIPQGQREKLSKGLEVITRQTFDELAASNFYTESHSMAADMMFATGAMAIDYGGPTSPIVCKACPISEVFPSFRMDGTVRAVYREYDCQVREITETWPTATLSPRLVTLAKDKPRAKVRIIEASMWSEAGWRFAVIDPESRVVMFERIDDGPDAPSRWIIAGFYRRPNERYHYGPAVVALPTIRSANKLEEIDLKAGAKNAAPPTLLDARAGMNPHTVRFGPNAVGMFDGAALQGAAPFHQMPPVGMPGWSDAKVDRYHRIIDSIFFATDVIPPVSESRNMTAYEVQVRKQMLLLQQGVNLGRLEKELPFAVFRRVVWLLVKHGHIHAPGFAIDGRNFTVEARGPLARARDAEKATSTLMVVSQSRSALGDQMTALGIKVEDVAARAAEMSPDFPTDLIRDQGEREELQKQAASVAAAQAAGGDPTMAQSVLPGGSGPLQ